MVRIKTVCFILNQGAEIPHARSKIQTQNKTHFVTNSIKILRWSTLKKKNLGEKKRLVNTQLRSSDSMEHSQNSPK